MKTDFLVFSFVITFGLGQAYALSEKGEEIHLNMERQFRFIEKSVNVSSCVQRKLLHLNRLITKEEHLLAHQLIRADDAQRKMERGCDPKEQGALIGARDSAE